MTARERFRRLTNARFWLTPGMGVKRHVLLASLGTLILIVGVIAGMLWLVQETRDVLSEPIEEVLVSPTWLRWGGWVSLFTAFLGLAVAVAAVGRLNRSLLSNWMNEPQEAAVVLHKRLELGRGPRLVALGGGTGLANLLRGLREHSSNITAVVTVSDDGGSSGRLRDAFGMPAPGDIVDCLAALSDYESEVSRLLEYRFERGGELTGHTFGNLLITTLTEVEGDFPRAIRMLNSLLNICGAVYPSSMGPVTLEVAKSSGARVSGESRVREVPGPIDKVSIHPHEAQPVYEVLDAIAAADLIVLGPGSLYTSTVPPLLVPATRRAILASKAPVAYVCNIMTEAGETDGYDAWAHVAGLHRHLGRYPDFVVVNTAPIDAMRLARYREEGADVVSFDPAPFANTGIELIGLELVGPGPHAQHDSARLAAHLVKTSREARLVRSRPVPQ